MAEDLAAVLDELDVGLVKIAAHDWGGPVAMHVLLRHPDRVTGFAGFNAVAPAVRDRAEGHGDHSRAAHGYRAHAQDITFEHVPGVGHWIVDEAHDLVLARIRAL